MYHSTDAHGRDIPVTGAVLTPTAAWTGTGPRPYVSFGVGTQGLGPQCAPSRQLQAGSEYETGNIDAALQRGYGVAVTDYEGYVSGATPTYVTGPSEAHAVLDVARAARQLPGADAGSSTPVGLWGYSQGGGATGWAAALAPSYAPDVHIVGAASGGVPADLKAVGANLNGNASGGLLGYSLVGFATAYPDLANFDQLTNDRGRQVAAQLKTECVGDTTVKHAFLNVRDLTKDHLSYAQFVALPGEAEILRRNNLGTAAPAPTVPVLQYHSAGDEIVPLPQAYQLHRTWCAKGTKTAFVVYPGEHLTGDPAGAAGALTFLTQRFAGAPFAGTCPL
jgi:dienelactone hydrolase